MGIRYTYSGAYTCFTRVTTAVEVWTVTVPFCSDFFYASYTNAFRGWQDYDLLKEYKADDFSKCHFYIPEQLSDM